MHAKSANKIIQDPIYGQIEIERCAVQLMDTVEF